MNETAEFVPLLKIELLKFVKDQALLKDFFGYERIKNNSLICSYYDLEPSESYNFVENPKGLLGTTQQSISR